METDLSSALYLIKWVNVFKEVKKQVSDNLLSDAMNDLGIYNSFLGNTCQCHSRQRNDLSLTQTTERWRDFKGALQIVCSDTTVSSLSQVC